MKKIIFALLACVIALSSLSTTVYAKNGSYNNNFNNMTQEDIDKLLFSYVAVADIDAKGEIVDIGYVYPKEFASEYPLNSKKITYDKKSNTLTLNGYKTENCLVLNAMGDDFKIKLVGKNELGSIASYDSLWGGSVTLTGSGTLEVNKKKSYGSAVEIDVSGTQNGFFKAEKSVGLKLYAFSKNYNSLVVSGTKQDDKSKVIVFGGETNKITVNKTHRDESGKNTYAVAENVTMNSLKFVTLAKVKLAKIQNTLNGVKVSWNAVSGASSYRVYRKANNETKWTRIATVKEISFTDTKVAHNNKYTYTVRATNGYVTGAYDKTGISTVFVSSPKVTLTNKSNGIKLYWDSVSGATGYIVYSSQYDASTKKWSSWKNRGTLKATKKSFTDKETENGIKYKYAVKAVKDKAKSSYKAVSLLYLSEPSVKISNISSEIKVNWNKNNSATGYRVYRSEYVNGKWSGWVKLKTVGANLTEYSDETAISGKQYRYTVKAVNGKSASSYKASSGLVCVNRPTVKISNTDKGIKVSWNKIGGATGYTVYSREYNAETKKWSSWKNRGTTKAKTLAWRDKKVKEGVRYKYTVRAVNGKVRSTYESTGGLTFLKTPQFNFTATEGAVNVSWSKINSANSYRVYRSELKDGKWSSWKRLTEINALTFTDTTITSGVEYRYTVRAKNGSSLSAYTTPKASVKVTVPETTVPVAVPETTVKTTQLNGMISDTTQK